MIIDLPRAEIEAIANGLYLAASHHANDDDDTAALVARADQLRAMLDDPDPEPIFPIKARDLLGGAAVQFYRAACRHAGLDHQAFEVSKALVDMGNWQVRHPTHCHLPDHKHQPANA